MISCLVTSRATRKPCSLLYVSFLDGIRAIDGLHFIHLVSGISFSFHLEYNFVSLDLDADNYLLWREQVLALFESLDLVGFADGTTALLSRPLIQH